MKSTPLPEDARTRILETAWRLIGERQDASVTLVEIAKESEVSRQTLYVNFGSRAGLLTAMVAHHDETSGGPAGLKRARRDASTDQALETFTRAWFKYVPDVFPVATALAVAARSDEDARAAWESRMQLVRSALLEITRGLAKSGQLKPGWTPEDAADWYFNLIHVDTWQHLVVERGWKPTDLVRHVVASLRATLLEV